MTNLETKHFVLSGILGALTFAVAFILGAGIITATGIPATGGIANIFAAIFILTIGVKIVPKFGFGTLTVSFLFVLAVPTVIGGPPGLYKVFNGIIIGLALDVVLYLGQRSRWAHVLGGALAATTSILSIYLALVVLGLPGAARLAPLLFPLSIFQFITGALASWAALVVFEKRLVKLQAVKRLQL